MSDWAEPALRQPGTGIVLLSEAVEVEGALLVTVYAVDIGAERGERPVKPLERCQVAENGPIRRSGPFPGHQHRIPGGVTTTSDAATRSAARYGRLKYGVSEVIHAATNGGILDLILDGLRTRTTT